MTSRGHNKLYIGHRIQKACTFLRKIPQFKEALPHIVFINDKTRTIPTIGISSNLVTYNAKWLQSLSDEILLGMIAHEILHYIYRHKERRDSRDMFYWNLACDYEVDETLDDMDIWTSLRSKDSFKRKFKNEINNVPAEVKYNKLMTYYTGKNGELIYPSWRSRDFLE